MTKVVEKNKIDKKVEKTTPVSTIAKKTLEIKPTKPIKSKDTTTTATNKPLNKEKEPSLKVINLEDLLNNKNKENKQDNKTTINSNLKGDKLVQEILSFFKLETNTVNLNESIEKLENEIKEKNIAIIDKVSNNYLMIMELVEKLIESNEVTGLVVLLMISRSVSSFNFPNLIESLIIKKDNFKIVSMVSKCFTDISSDNIKDLVQYIISNKQFKSIKDQLEQLQNLSSSSTNDITACKELDSILTIPVTHDSMVVSIRSLSLSTVLLLLKYLYSRISLFSLDDTQENNNTFTLKQIVDWISLIFDSHFQELSKVENINQYFGPIRSLHNNTKSFFYTKSFIDFLEKSSSTKSIENNNYSIYHYKF
ncbi:hypothetical protein DICPUDRAFT_152720 [Dictyostelium purpureum]|uniref:Nucleolar protein 11 C-terminal domain-containing protein n=1 Tax=Dictyostelium purpureum TaxID=5786 RepID=F0ZM40_DICPU|nr:uncharacterized protein DICPUDRAFT_152720 [Dictyostelium purpureum]EGC34959.1 hypothetical protein DICPUDRAFT_152720 [Dictyostelium purpureum]|eukprot:XP_003288484.1 hypothetical protein DICPUDRAFT_152720 [Dictyostelium purpureum]